jgi:hypothetical protein
LVTVDWFPITSRRCCYRLGEDVFMKTAWRWWSASIDRSGCRINWIMVAVDVPAAPRRPSCSARDAATAYAVTPPSWTTDTPLRRL